MDTLQPIRFFLKLAETLSFKDTARHFGVPSSTVSRSIKRLEDHLGVALFHRTTRQVRLSMAGEWYREEVAGPMRALSLADELVGAQSKEPVGTIRITAVPGYAEILLFNSLDRFRKRYPNIVCDLELSNRYLDLSSGDYDIAIRATADPPVDLVARRLHSNRFVLVASPDYLQRAGVPKTVADIQEHASLIYRGAQGLLPMLARRPTGEIEDVPRTPALVANNGLYLLNAARAGEGISFLPLWGVADDLKAGTLQRIELEDAELTKRMGSEMSVYLLYHPNKMRLGKVRAAVDFLSADLAGLDSSLE